jgi:hypothetical protein
MSGLLVFTYRHDGGDCTNGGLSSKHDQFVLTWGETGPFEPDAKTPELVLVKGPYNSLRAVPRKLVESKQWVMFGGNFVYTSDSRFPSDQPIKIFDRVETEEQSRELSQ